MQVLIVNNISAGGGMGADLYSFLRAFSSDGDTVVMRVTDSATPAESLVDDAADFDAVVVAGGDGTVASVCYALRGTGVPVMPFPTGTANLLALNLDFPMEPYALAQMLRECETLDFDMGEFITENGKAGFMLIAGAGYDASIMENASKLKTSLGDAAYWVTALANPNPTTSHFTIKLDGRTIERDGIAVLLVNFGRVQFDLSITPENNAHDGLLEVAILKPQYTVQLFPILVAALLDRDGSNPTRTDALEVHRAREVEIYSDPPLTTQFDGEPTGLTTPIAARALPAAIRLIVDKKSAGIIRMLEDGNGK